MTVRVSITVNDQPTTAEVDERTLLSDFLREVLGLTGTHRGCDTAQCGACTIHLNGHAVKSCNVLAVQAENSTVTTIEALADASGRLHPLQEAFRECHGLQCGYCTPGMIMSALDLLKHTPDPDAGTIRNALEGNLCRCTGYDNIVKAVQQAARQMRG